MDVKYISLLMISSTKLRYDTLRFTIDSLAGQRVK